MALGIFFAISACGDDGSTLFVDVRTDLVPGAEFTGVEVHVAGQRGDSVARLEMDFISGVRVASFSGLTPGTIEGTMALIDERGIILERDFIVELQTNPQTLTIVLSRDCRGVDCAGSATGRACLAGQCAGAGCSVEAPEQCLEVDECSTSSDCPAQDPCSDALCELGACLYRDADRCAPGNFCDPEIGCRAVPSSVDAGVQDAASDVGVTDSGVLVDSGAVNDTGPDVTPDAGPPTDGGGALACPSGVAPDLMALVNGDRAADGAVALSCNESLSAAAAEWNQIMCDQGFVGNSAPGGQQIQDVTGPAGGFESNTASGFSTPSTFHAAVMRNTITANIVLNPTYRTFGAATLACGGRNLWTEVLGR